MKFVLLYESAEDVASKAPPEFVAGDPFVLNGVVRGYEIRGWNEMFSGD